MTIEITEKTYTVPEFLDLEFPDDDDNEYELIGGIIMARPKSGVSAKHGRIVSKICSQLEWFAGGKFGKEPFGETFAGASCTLGQTEGSDYVVPDVCFVLNGRLPASFSGAIPLVPDLIIEVNSPSDTLQRIHNKLESYRKAAVRLVWSINMLEKYVLVYRTNDPDAKFVNFNGELEGEDVLPGFKLPVKALFD